METLADGAAYIPLPNPRTRLIGREAERTRGQELLLDDAAPLVTLTGPGGVGKTRVALAVAADVASRFSDGVVWVDLAPVTDPDHVPTAVALALGLSPSPDGPVVTDVIRYLRPRQTLLLLDNCEHLLSAVADLVARLLTSCPALQVLATSRAPLRVRGEQETPIEPLPLPPVDTSALLEVSSQNEAVRLFTERARSVRPAFTLEAGNVTTVVAVCRHLDGLPLAIELAAARMKILSAEALLAQMSDRLRLLSDGPRDVPSRQKTIRATITWSYGLLTPEEQALFRRLAVFVGGFTLDAAARVSGWQGIGVAGEPGSPTSRLATDTRHPTPDTLRRIAALVDQSLLRRMEGDGEPRFTMLETIREFGLERLAESGEADETRDRHATHFMDLAESATLQLHGMLDDQAGWMARIDRELGNIRAALDWLLGIGDGLRALRLIIGLEAYIGSRPFEAEARRWVETALALAPDAPPTVRAAALYGLITRTAMLGDYAASLAAAEEAVAIAETQSDPFILGRAYFGLGMAAAWDLDTVRAADAYARAVPYLRQTDRLDFLALALSLYGSQLTELGDVSGAIAPIEEGLACYSQGLDPFGHAVTLQVRAELAHRQGSFDLAVRLLAEAIATARTINEERQVMDMVANLAHIALDTGQPERAVRLLGAIAAAQVRLGIVRIWSRDRIERIEAPARAELGDDAFTAAWEAGRSMPWDDAVTDALAVLDRDAAIPAPGPPTRTADPFTLTRREREVLGLLCERFTDPEIGERLHVSPRTIESHVARILDKLGARNRRDAAATAARLGIV